jgi:Prolyl oligopeptidase, N-terminal beta-propeller domain
MIAICRKESLRMRCLLCFLLITSGVFGQDVPSATKRPVGDEYHGVRVVDNYRWLEDGTSAETSSSADLQQQVADLYTFLFQELDVTYRPVQ